MADDDQPATRVQAPATGIEQGLRYALAAPLIRGAALWCDLGCGSPAAAAAALSGGEQPARTVLVAGDQDALETAARELRQEGAVTVAADLADASDTRRVRAELLEHAGEGTRCITCFDTIDHLEHFAPLVGMLGELAEQHGFTVLLGTAWQEESVEELRRLLPAEHLVFRQVALAGSGFAQGEPETHAVDVELDPAGTASHFVAVFGPERERAAPAARVVQVDVEERRRAERRRTADLEYALERLRRLESP